MKKTVNKNRETNVKFKQTADNASEFLKSLANTNRLIILSCLKKGESCVGDLEKNLDISQSALSQHLSRMRGQGILSRRRESQQVFYSINDDRVEKFLELVFDDFNVSHK